MLKYSLVAVAILMFTGCGDTIDSCKSAGYSGVVVAKNTTSPELVCSDGEIINGKIKADGVLYPISVESTKYTSYTFLKFTNDNYNIKPQQQEGLQLNTINMLQDAAKTCNKAKVTLIAGAQTITEQRAFEIIKECSLYKLDSELQR